MPIMEVLDGRALSTPPIWLMRQAGRYLPEYREIRTRAPSFLEFCYNPALAEEATLQPIRRYGFNAAILFCDILVVPHALGQKVTFETGEGPRLEPVDTREKFAALKKDNNLTPLRPVFETIANVRAKLPREVALLGFCGAPWTVASYMIAGRGTPDQAPARIFAYENRELFSEIIDLLTDYSIHYLLQQLNAGVNAVQIFDSWSGSLPAAEFDRWCFKPLKKIVEGVRREKPDAKIIAFPRGASTHLSSVAQIEGLSCLGLDTYVDPGWAANELQPIIPVQGNLDPLALLTGGQALFESLENILGAFAGRPHIFNLGHGILPPTPMEHVSQAVDYIRNWKR